MNKPKIKLLAALLALAVFGIRAGYAQTTSDNVTLNVKLIAVQNISVEHDLVHLTFNEANDYLNGVDTTLTSHLKVSSTGLFQVKVNSLTENLVSGLNNIPVSTITVTPDYVTGTDPGADEATVALSTTANTILDSDYGTTQVFYSVTYTASGGADYIDKPTGTYTTTVTYTISPT